MLSLRRFCKSHSRTIWFCLILWLAGRCVLSNDFELLSTRTNRSTSPLQDRTAVDPDVSFNGTLRNEVEFYESLSKTSGSCRKLLSFGGFSCHGHMDGDKSVCMDEHLPIPRDECLVYSFGVGDDISFEDSFSIAFNCEVHLYDPLDDPSWFIGNLSTKTYYHQKGLSVFNNVVQSSGNYTPKRFSPFDDLLTENGHLKRTIHYLKMDIEASEWTVLRYMMDRGLLDNVMQLQMEIHTKHIEKLEFRFWLPTLQNYYDTLMHLEDLGFKKISYVENVNLYGAIKLPYEKMQRPGCGEIFYIRDPKHIRS